MRAGRTDAARHRPPLNQERDQGDAQGPACLPALQPDLRLAPGSSLRITTGAGVLPVGTAGRPPRVHPMTSPAESRDRKSRSGRTSRSRGNIDSRLTVNLLTVNAPCTTSSVGPARRPEIAE